jgi:hypothetical protein
MRHQWVRTGPPLALSADALRKETMSDANLVRIRNREITDSHRTLLYFAVIVIAVVIMVGSLVLVL